MICEESVVLGGVAHWCVAGRSAGSKVGMDGWIDCVDLGKLQGKAGCCGLASAINIGESAFRLSPCRRIEDPQERNSSRRQLELKPATTYYDLLACLLDVARSVKFKPLDYNHHHHSQP